MRGASLLEDQVFKIRRDVAAGVDKRQIAGEHDISIRHVNMIACRKVWKHLVDEQGVERSPGRTRT